MTMKGTPSLTVPPTQNTAPVLEFNCLYTHDIRRKQKRWQDGFLRFHTFNKRIMVYDIPRNLIGGTHWNGDQLENGDEVTLDKGGVLVQVAELVGRTETDLTEILKSKKKTTPNRAAASSSPIRIPTHHAATRPIFPPTRPVPTHAVPSKHRSLNALLGTPRGPIGKAVLPTSSPFEEKPGIENEPWETGRPAKRPRVERSHGANPIGSNVIHSAKPHQRQQEVIDLCSQSLARNQFLAGFSDDALLSPCSSPQHRPNKPTKSAPVRSSSPAFQRQMTPEKERLLRREAKPNSQSANDTNIPNVSIPSVQRHDVAQEKIIEVPLVCPKIGEFAQDIPRPQQLAEAGTEPDGRPISRPIESSFSKPAIRDHLGTERQQLGGDTQSPGRKSGRTLRMAASAPKRKTLLCQNQLSSRPDDARSGEGATMSHPSLKVTSRHFDRPSQRHQLQQRLAKIGKKTMKSHETPATLSQSLDLSPSNAGNAGLPNRAAEPNQIQAAAAPTEAEQQALSKSASTNFSPRQLRRVVSESDHLRDESLDRSSRSATRSPTARAPITEQVAGQDTISGASIEFGGLKPRAKKAMDRAVSLNLASNGTSNVILRRQFRARKPPKLKIPTPDAVANPWSREAFDLFTWRPPGWDEETWCVRAADTVAVD